ncbi:MAG: hypothetical protein JWP74_32 [Marmoricola sp.]|nr:hypothetical protein [Marmoricola sp.]
MHINGLPLHPLVVHLVVVLAPTAGILAVLFAVVPKWRWWTRLPFVAASVVGAVATWVAATSGGSLKHQLGLRGHLIAVHEMWAGRLQASMWTIAAVALVAWWVLPFKTPLEGRPDKPARVAVLRKPLVALLPLIGLVVVFLVYKTGDAGARLVWAG